MITSECIQASSPPPSTGSGRFLASSPRLSGLPSSGCRKKTHCTTHRLPQNPARYTIHPAHHNLIVASTTTLICPKALSVCCQLIGGLRGTGRWYWLRGQDRSYSRSLGRVGLRWWPVRAGNFHSNHVDLSSIRSVHVVYSLLSEVKVCDVVASGDAARSLLAGALSPILIN